MAFSNDQRGISASDHVNELKELDQNKLIFIIRFDQLKFELSFSQAHLLFASLMKCSLSSNVSIGILKD